MNVEIGSTCYDGWPEGQLQLAYGLASGIISK